MKTFKNSVLISKELPLISNLNMIENIAIIEEFHNRITTNEAHSHGFELLKKINCESIAYKHINECSYLELFYVMLLRAIMCKEDVIIVCYVYFLVEDLETLDPIVEVLENLKIQKKIVFVDSKKNKHLYGQIKLVDEGINEL